MKPAKKNFVTEPSPKPSPCPACDASLAPTRHVWLWRCKSCGILASTAIPNIPIESTPSKINEIRRRSGLQAVRSLNNSAVLNAITRATGPGPKRLLDVGSGLGFFLTAAANRGFAIAGVEPDANVIEAARASGVSVRHGYFPDCLEKSAFFDVITFNDVFEHIPDVGRIMIACSNHLAPGGLLVINLPDRKGIFYRVADCLDRLGFHGPFDRMWQRGLPSPHLWYFSHPDIQRLGAKNGFTAVQKLSLRSITLRGIFNRVFYVEDQSIITGLIATFGAVVLWPILSIFPSDISVIVLRRHTS